MRTSPPALFPGPAGPAAGPGRPVRDRCRGAAHGQPEVQGQPPLSGTPPCRHGRYGGNGFPGGHAGSHQDPARGGGLF